MEIMTTHKQISEFLKGAKPGDTFNISVRVEEYERKRRKYTTVFISPEDALLCDKLVEVVSVSV